MKRSLLPVLALLPALATAQDLNSLIEATARDHAAGLPGELRIEVGQPKPPLPPCERPQAFMPSGSKPWGEVQVGVRCQAGAAWTRFVPVQIQAQVRHAVAALALPAGHRLLASDVQWSQADLARLPKDAVLDEAGLAGSVSLKALAPGAPLRRELLRAPAVIAQGQRVRVLTQGPGFVLSTEGKAQSSAASGQALLVRLSGGQVISAVAQSDGTAQK